MNRVRVLAAAAVGVVLLGAGVASAAGPYPPPSKGTGTVTPSKIKAGECAVFSGDGFAPLTPVSISDSTGDASGSTVTTTNGTFSQQLCYSTSAHRGRHNLAGSGTGSDGSPLTVYAVLTVQGVQQSASNPSTQSGGQAVSLPAGGHSGGQDAGTTGGPTLVTGGTSGAVQAPTDESLQPPTTPGQPSAIAPTAGENSGTRLLLLGLTGLGFAFGSSLFLLLLARRRRRREDVPGTPLDLPGAPA